MVPSFESYSFSRFWGILRFADVNTKTQVYSLKGKRSSSILWSLKQVTSKKIPYLAKNIVGGFLEICKVFIWPNNTKIKPSYPTCLTEMAIAPFICMLQKWFLHQKMAHHSGLCLRFKLGR